jgi:hypothetical protein
MHPVTTGVQEDRPVARLRQSVGRAGPRQLVRLASRCRAQTRHGLTTLTRTLGRIGIFPEGSSHDRADLLPLKAGVTLMALGAAAQHNVEVQIVPCGLTYFHGHRYNSHGSLLCVRMSGLRSLATSGGRKLTAGCACAVLGQQIPRPLHCRVRTAARGVSQVRVGGALQRQATAAPGVLRLARAGRKGPTRGTHSCTSIATASRTSLTHPMRIR